MNEPLKYMDRRLKGYAAAAMTIIALGAAAYIGLKAHERAMDNYERFMKGGMNPGYSMQCADGAR